MGAFLEQVAGKLLEEHGRELHQVAVILPSTRAGLHLRRYLAQRAEGALWSPEMLTWDGFTERLSGQRLLGDLEALFELFAAHRETRTTPDDLDAFLAWGPTVLADIDDAEAQLLDLARFYTDLRAVEGIEHWSLGADDLSPGQQRLVGFWQQQGQLHRAFRERTESKGAGTSGMLARWASASLRNGADAPWSAVWFVGLNAFTAGQEAIVDVLVRNGKARLCWNGDRMYVDHPVHEAGLFLRKAIARYGDGLVPIADDLRTLERAIRLDELPTTIAQTFHASHLLNSLTPEERERTAVVLADESLLVPLLDALPEDIGPVNVTMGLRVHDLPVNGLISAFLELHQQYDPVRGYPVQPLERVFSHPFLRPPEERNTLSTVSDGAAHNGHIPHGGLQAVIPRNAVGEFLLKSLEPIQGDASLLPARLSALLTAALTCVRDRPFEREQLYRMSRMHHVLQTQLARAGLVYDVAAYERLHQRLVRQQRITFFGEPLQGLQIMGMLETRAVDHERVIVLSCNEGTLPPSSSDRTFVPFDVRVAYGLPLAKDRDALGAYTFHRLLQRARHVHLLHTAEGSDAANGPSRYFQQLKADASRTRTAVGDAAFHASMVTRAGSVIAVIKDGPTLERLKAVLSKGISPSALGCYLRCPLDFHFKYILGLKEPETLRADLANNVLGTAVHEALRIAWEPLIGKTLSPRDISDVADRLPMLLRQQVLLIEPRALVDSGHARLQMTMASEAMRRSIMLDAENLSSGNELEFIAMEQAHHVDMSSADKILGTPLRIKGRIDRVDRYNGIHRIMDIKTGSVRVEDLKLRNWDVDELNARKEKALQLGCYAYMFLHGSTGLPGVEAGIIPLQKPSLASRCTLQVKGDKLVRRAMLVDIERMIISLVSRMLDPSKPFIHSPEANNCAFCARWN